MNSTSRSTVPPRTIHDHGSNPARMLGGLLLVLLLEGRPHRGVRDLAAHDHDGVVRLRTGGGVMTTTTPTPQIIRDLLARRDAKVEAALVRHGRADHPEVQATIRLYDRWEQILRAVLAAPAEPDEDDLAALVDALAVTR